MYREKWLKLGLRKHWVMGSNSSSNISDVRSEEEHWIINKCLIGFKFP